ncbi:MAG: hydantoinase B/oxoprolinase family protein [Pseudomonadota bacterium]
MTADIDLITLEVVLEYFLSTVREMGKTIIRTAHSSIIYEGHDFSCAILSATGELVAQSEGSPAHTIPLPWQVREALAFFDDRLNPGDVVLVNDCFASGTHMNDVAMIVPFFAEGRRVAIVVSRAHWGDVGGMTPGSISGRATEFFQEGLRIPFVKVFDAGKPVPGLLELILANVRVPEEREGDFYAMLACCHTAQQRLSGLTERFGGRAGRGHHGRGSEPRRTAHDQGHRPDQARQLHVRGLLRQRQPGRPAGAAAREAYGGAAIDRGRFRRLRPAGARADQLQLGGHRPGRLRGAQGSARSAGCDQPRRLPADHGRRAQGHDRER